MKAQCAAVFFYQQPWQLDSFNVSAGVGWMTLFHPPSAFIRATRYNLRRFMFPIYPSNVPLDFLMVIEQPLYILDLQWRCGTSPL